MSGVLFALSLAISLVFKLTLFKNLNYGLGWWDALIILALYPILTLVHEGLHAVGFMLGGASKSSVKFGAIAKKMMLYCTTTKPLSPLSYKFSLVLPFLTIGIIYPEACIKER